MKKRGPEHLMWELQFYHKPRKRKNQGRKPARWVTCETGWCTWRTIVQYQVSEDLPRRHYRYRSNTNIHVPFLGVRL